LPKYERYGPTDAELATYTVSGWNRATLQWDLGCDTSGQTRLQGYEALTADYGIYTGYGTYRKVGIALCCVYTTLFVLNLLTFFLLQSFFAL